MAGASVSDLESLYQSGWARFVRVATAILHDEQRAIDAVQEAFAAALRDRERFRGDGPLEAWVWRIVVNAATKERNRLRPVPIAEIGTEAPESAEYDTVREAIAALPERQRLVLFLRYYADLDYDSIARALEIKPGTVAATLHAAHAAVRASLQEVDR
jgi:RNA polymerase sigma-70 factor (ECF subfamily)